jgi:hypothetical protein
LEKNLASGLKSQKKPKLISLEPAVIKTWEMISRNNSKEGGRVEQDFANF